jgi:hypothetical protein
MADEELDPKIKAEIDAMTYEQLLERWRNDPSGSPLFQGASGIYARILNEVAAELRTRVREEVRTKVRNALSGLAGLPHDADVGEFIMKSVSEILEPYLPDAPDVQVADASIDAGSVTFDLVLHGQAGPQDKPVPPDEPRGNLEFGAILDDANFVLGGKPDGILDKPHPALIDLKTAYSAFEHMQSYVGATGNGHHRLRAAQQMAQRLFDQILVKLSNLPDGEERTQLAINFANWLAARAVDVQIRKRNPTVDAYGVFHWEPDAPAKPETKLFRLPAHFVGVPEAHEDATSWSVQIEIEDSEAHPAGGTNSASLVFLMEEPRKWLDVHTQLEVFLGPKKVGTFEVRTVMLAEPET